MKIKKKDKAQSKIRTKGKRVRVRRNLVKAERKLVKAKRKLVKAEKVIQAKRTIQLQRGGGYNYKKIMVKFLRRKRMVKLLRRKTIRVVKLC